MSADVRGAVYTFVIVAGAATVLYSIMEGDEEGLVIFLAGASIVAPLVVASVARVVASLLRRTPPPRLHLFTVAGTAVGILAGLTGLLSLLNHAPNVFENHIDREGGAILGVALGAAAGAILHLLRRPEVTTT